MNINIQIKAKEMALIALAILVGYLLKSGYIAAALSLAALWFGKRQ